MLIFLTNILLRFDNTPPQTSTIVEIMILDQFKVYCYPKLGTALPPPPPPFTSEQQRLASWKIIIFLGCNFILYLIHLTVNIIIDRYNTPIAGFIFVDVNDGCPQKQKRSFVAQSKRFTVVGIVSKLEFFNTFIYIKQPLNRHTAFLIYYYY